jgi:hypothetical protein
MVVSSCLTARLGMKQIVLQIRRLRVHADAKCGAFLIVRSHDSFAGSSPSGGMIRQDARLLWPNLVEMRHALPGNQTNKLCVRKEGTMNYLA